MPDLSLTTPFPETSLLGRLRALVRVPAADESVARWHVSPLVDLGAYAFGWAWILVPLVFVGDSRADYLAIYLVAIALTATHRHLSFPYVYLDAQVRRMHLLRFTLFPAVMFAGWVCAPWLTRQPIAFSLAGASAFAALAALLVQALRRDHDDSSRLGRKDLLLGALPLASAGLVMASGSTHTAWAWIGAALASSIVLEARRPDRKRFLGPIVIAAIAASALVFGPRVDAEGIASSQIVDAVALFAGAWNIWHVFMQKYGILRMYSAKSGQPEKVAAYKDRLLLFAWLPLICVWLALGYRDAVLDHLGGTDGVLLKLVDAITSAKAFALPTTIALVVVSSAIWLVAEARAHRFKNFPRLWMGVGTSLLAASFLAFDPVKVYLAYAFSHAVEYTVFVWAFQRRRYLKPLAHAPMMGRLLSRPLLAYGAFIVGLSLLYLYLKTWGRDVAPLATPPEVFGVGTSELVATWGVYQSMVHFYFDGFLWKMRLPSVRASL